MSKKIQNIGYFKTGTQFTTIIDNVTNSGPEIATDVIVNITVPDGIQCSSSSVEKGSFNSVNNRWTVGTVDVDETVTANFTWEITDPTIGEYEFKFKVSSTTACSTCLDTDTLCVEIQGIYCSELATCCSIKTVSSETYSLQSSDETILVDASANTVDITLPTPNNECRKIIKVIDHSNQVTVTTPSGVIVDDQIPASSTATYNFTTTGETIVLQSDDTNWYIIS